MKLSAEFYTTKELGRCWKGEVICEGWWFYTSDTGALTSSKEAKRVVADGAGWWLCFGSKVEGGFEGLVGDGDGSVS